MPGPMPVILCGLAPQTEQVLRRMGLAPDGDAVRWAANFDAALALSQPVAVAA